MKSLVAEHAKDNKITGDILKIGIEAREASLKYDDAVNSTVGMLFEDDGSMTVFDTVMEVVDELKPTEYLPYPATPGTPAFQEAVAKWVFRQHFNYINENMHWSTMATPGGSGAIANTFDTYLKPGQKCLLPDLGWKPYKIMTKNANVIVEEYKLFDENDCFNVASFKEKCWEIAKEQGRVLAVINDPCQNPTGYGMTYEEWQQVIAIYNELAEAGYAMILLYDLAYIDYHDAGLDASRKNLELMKDLHENVIVICAFSGSKTFSFYGIRIGAQVALSNNKDAVDEFTRVCQYGARGKWSSSANIGIQTIAKLFNDQEKTKRFELELKKASELLSKRGKIFVSEAKECGLEIFPHKSGYFVTLPNCGDDVYEALKDNRIYTIPMPGNLVRFAMSSMPTEQIYGLAARVKKIIDSV
jgi:aspartate/tyrosine/aromatic aminotransferase